MTMIDCCEIPDCHGKPKAKGLCSKHYGRLWRHGSPHITIGRPPIRGPRTHELQLSLFTGRPSQACGQLQVLALLPTGHFAPQDLLPLFPLLSKSQLLKRLCRLALKGKIKRIRAGHYHKEPPR